MDSAGEMLQELIIQISEGNVGAMMCCLEMIKNSVGSINAVLAIKRAEQLGIVGDKLYLVWNDCCDRDGEKTLRVLMEKGKDEILDHIDVLKHGGRGKAFD